ncbi:hypothetical protein KY332_04305 [Candidatus Woesearchaeota archaeon]|nr:hypothetical protein [Candidatus Woesearchaeota archaeon]
MKRESKTELAKKGWSKEDIDKAENIIKNRREQDKSGSVAYIDKVLFWGILFVMVVGNTLVSFGIIPLFLVFDHLAMDLFIIVIGFSVGLLFNFLIWNVEEHLTRKHHLTAVVIIPFLAVLNLYFMVTVSNAINNAFNLSSVRDSPLTISALYVIAFLVPYLWTLLVRKKIKRY